MRPDAGLDGRLAAALAAVLLLCACSAPSDVTGSAGEPTAAPAGPATPVSGPIDPVLVAELPACPATERRPPVPDGLPDLAMACLGPGSPVALSGLRGPLIINTWASWCAPCRQELPALAAFAQQPGQEVAVLGLNVSDSPAAAAGLWGELAMPFPSLADPDAATRPGLAWVGLPVSYFVDSEGRLAGRHVGAIPDQSGWQEAANRILGAG